MTGEPEPRRARRDDWRVVLLVYCLTAAFEGVGVSQVYAFVPAYLAGMGVGDPDRFRFVGVMGSLIFIVGTPFVPLWGVWADKHSRKVVIARSSVVMAAVLAGVALSREPWQLALSMLLIAFQFGNTGVMLAAIRDVTPPRLLGRAIALFGAASPLGFAIGPVIGGLVVDGLHLGLSTVFWTSAALALAVACLVSFGTHEVRPEFVPEGGVLRLAWRALAGVVRDRSVLVIFGIFVLPILANQMTRGFLPILVEGVVPPGAGLASSIGFVTGLAAIGGAALSPLGGAIGDRVGFRPVLLAALIAGGLAFLSMPFAGGVEPLAAAALTSAAAFSIASAMVFGLVATEVPPERRSATLNLIYLPLYAAGIVGPAAGALAIGVAGIHGPFFAGAVVFLVAATAVAIGIRRRQRGRSRSAGPV